MKRKSRSPNPTPKQIRDATKEIRKNWDERTHLIRHGYPPNAADQAKIWVAPLLEECELLSIMRELGNTTSYTSLIKED